jgi:tRNA A-37 threonylcarbamoyl transferase component Bud32
VAETRERIGAYEVVRLIARGGMATVYEAYQPALDRSVALKRLDLRSHDPMQAERFINESRLSASFNHPNIVTVFDFFEHEGVPYIAMEYLPRGSLRSCVGTLSMPQVFGVVEGMLKGLAHAQESGVAHRDLKPENVLITRTGSVKIADFGIAKAYYSAAAKLSATGIAVGTPAYMAPEQAMAQPVGPYTDLYAVGVITYEMLSGGTPFEGGESPVAVMYKHVSESPPPLTGVDSRVGAWVARLLEKAPADRPPGAEEAWRELEPRVVDLLGPFWRNDATLGEIPKDEYVTVVGGEPVRLETPGEPEPAPEPEDDYITVAGGEAAAPEPEIAAAAEPEAEAARESEPEIEAAPEPEPELGVTAATRRPHPAPQEGSGWRAEPAADAGSGWRAEPVDRGRRRSRRGLLVGGAVVGVAAVVAVVLVLGSGGGGSPRDGAAAGSGKAAAAFDFDGDGRPTAVVGTPDRQAGSVTVDPGAEPLTPANPTAHARFGAAIASADFDRDGRADLAVGAPGAGSVTVYAGSSDGLSNPTRLSGKGRFGAALAAGDVDGDGYGDLLVGAPAGDGAVQLFPGSAKGLTRPRTIDAPTGTNGFGAVLALGDVDHDGKLDLAEGGTHHASHCPSVDACEPLGTTEPAALAIADVTGDGFGDIVQGHPNAGEDAPIQFGTGSGPPGQIEVWRGGADGPAAKPLVLDENTTGVAGNNQALDEFGAALALGDLDGDGTADLVIGAPGEDADRGRVTIVRGGRRAHGPTDVAGYGGAKQQTKLPIAIRPGSRFGSAVQLLDVDGDGHLDLIGALPGNGYVLTLPGDAAGTFVKKGSESLRLPDGVHDIALGTAAP